LLRERTVSEVLARDGASEKLDELAHQVATRKKDPYSAVDEILRG
jgi:hypothetical protein